MFLKYVKNTTLDAYLILRVEKYDSKYKHCIIVNILIAGSTVVLQLYSSFVHIGVNSVWVRSVSCDECWIKDRNTSFSMCRNLERIKNLTDCYWVLVKNWVSCPLIVWVFRRGHEGPYFGKEHVKPQRWGIASQKQLNGSICMLIVNRPVAQTASNFRMVLWNKSSAQRYQSRSMLNTFTTRAYSEAYTFSRSFCATNWSANVSSRRCHASASTECRTRFESTPLYL